jgi:hypothetical protein
LRNHRERLYGWLRQCLVGPGVNADIESEESNLTGTKPLDRYHVGVLFPIIKGLSGTDPASGDEIEEEEDLPIGGDPESNAKETAKPDMIKRRYVPPSSAGFSFFIRGDDIRLQIAPWAVRYQLEKRDRDPSSGQSQSKLWIRKLFADQDRHLRDFYPPENRIVHAERREIFNDLAEIFILWRPHDDGWLTTVSLSNRQEFPDKFLQKDYRNKQNELSFFETQLECVIESGKIGTYPRVDPQLLSEEDQEIELQYKDRRIYGIGHGTAVDWEEKNGIVRKIWIDFFPKVEVPQVSVDSEGLQTNVLELAFLCRYPYDPKHIGKKLETFVNSYDLWVSDKENAADNLQEKDRKIAARIISRMKQAVMRMRQGLRLLEQDRIVAHAFGIANESMNRQMKQYDQTLGKPEKPYRWRPFQLAFLLMVIESTVNEDSQFRDTLDLIWFPTGGGKTEAYLGLIAFLIAWRRARFPTSGSGTTVLMRYTLRLLTKQQFQRASRLICALELMRREQPEKKLGHEPISVGMWVGEGLSPNIFATAQQIVMSAVGENAPALQKLVLDCCPWCRRPFSPAVNFVATSKCFAFRCDNPDCDFGKPESVDAYLPCNVVDEALYQDPPSLLLSTVDKFARLPWEERAGAFFGLNGNRPPELIIQDELHLITGALGSIAGLYEAALDTVLCYRGIYPKYIASTATIRMAKQQVQHLYGRPLAVFPPPGLSIDDSFFARTVPIKKKPGRLYVGYLAHNLTRQKSFAPLAAALLAAPEVLFSEDVDQELLLDAWWTLVVYHGSLKGVGTSHNALNIDVPNYWKSYLRAANYGQGSDMENNENDSEKFPEKKGRLNGFLGKIAQLTSISGPEENALTFNRLEYPRTDSRYLDVVLATNMVSVGLDVSRLSTMVVKGQPLTTAEYIQTSSRVGRGLVPGIVVANYYRDQARSLSYYESFRSYHESFYRFVEPSSVTPYTYQARQRALHAALVITVRYCCQALRGNQTAGDFDPDSAEVKRAVNLLSLRCQRADPSHANEIENHLQRLVEQWKHEALRCREDQRRLDYQAPENNNASDRLLCNHDDRIQGLWHTLQSMRNVENTGLLKML